MEDRILTFINGDKYFKESVPRFIEVFVKFYGEEKREEIEEKFNNALFIGYQDPENLKRGIYRIEDLKTKELLEDISKKLNIPVDTLTDRKSFRYQILQPINKVFNLLESVNTPEEVKEEEFYNNGYLSVKRFFHDLTTDEYKELWDNRTIPERYEPISDWLKENIEYTLDKTRIDNDEKRIYKELEEFLLKVNKNITEDNYKTLLKEEPFSSLLNLKDEYIEAKNKYDEYTSALEEYYEEMDMIESHKIRLYEEIFMEFLKENLDLIPQEKIDGVLQVIEENKGTYDFDNYIRKVFGYSIMGNSLLEDFSRKSEEELNDENTNSWIKNSIKENRISFFKLNGINLNTDYEGYIDDERVKAIIPSEERIDKFLECKNKYINKFNNRFYTELPRHRKIEEEITKKCLVDKDPPINAKTYIESCCYVSPNIVKDNLRYKIAPLVIINFDDYDENTKDHMIVHELNHLYELSLGLASSNYYEALCGWDVLKEETNTIGHEVNTLEESSKRDYELFNEIINEIIAQEISKLMHEEDIYIFDDKKSSRYTHTTSYEHSLFLVRDFYLTYKDKIIESRSNGNIDVIFNEVGKENFDELNNLFSVYFESFGGMKIYNLLNSLHNNEDNELTRTYNELIEKRDLILEKMKNYKKKQEIDNYNK